MIPETRWATSGDLSIAYQVVGQGPPDVVFVQGFVSHVELAWEMPTFGPVYARLASFARLVVFDKRGVGLSDRTPRLPTLEERMDDVRAVMDAAGVERAALIGISEGGPMALLFAATYPERTSALVLWATFARTSRGPDYPGGWAPEDIEQRGYEVIRSHWGTGQALRRISFQDAPADDPAVLQLLARYERYSATPRVAVETLRFGAETDVRHVLGAVSAPTLVVHRTGDPLIPVGDGRYLAEHIRGARLVELPGAFHLSAAHQDGPVLDAIEDFLTGTRAHAAVDRVLKTIVFTDIVASTARAAEVGDRRWRALLDAHEAAIRRELARARGVAVKTTGDGVLAAFDGPARAIRCAQAITAQARALGLAVRAGVHTGECELRGDDLAGIAVHIGARVADAAAPGEVLVTGTVRDLVAGSGIAFDDRGMHALRGVPGEWPLLAVRPPRPEPVSRGGSGSRA
jgi:pimeloyl-ACP methyl ester carboxylesterase